MAARKQKQQMLLGCEEQTWVSQGWKKVERVWGNGCFVFLALLCNWLMVLFAAATASFSGWLCVFHWTRMLRYGESKHPSCWNAQLKSGWNCEVSAASFCFVGWDLCGPLLEVELCSVKWTWLSSEVNVFKDVLWLMNWTKFAQSLIGLQMLPILSLLKDNQIAGKGWV